MQQLNYIVTQSNQPAQLMEKMRNLYSQLQSIKAQRNLQNEQPEIWRTVRERDAAQIAQVRKQSTVK